MSYLLVLGEREALAWVLREGRMAFPATRRHEVDRLAVGDELFLLTTRGCFHNPVRDRTRVIGRAVVSTRVEPLDPPLELVGRRFTRGCKLDIGVLAPYRTGVEVAPLVPKLDAFPRKDVWSIWLRRPLVSLGQHDVNLIWSRLRRVGRPVSEHLPTYLESIRPVAAPGR
ncbi:hypothetical protein HEB94_000597 [Actinopolymorpha pittospori]|uniref:Uncharacterized protein n=1 Tax=Actinopolymorpha pittospori TaxID=648752 RepID=A0A927MPL0_9ACTN|nr:hypothetical protein [Actinopolymorpha pittospori]